MRPFIFAAFALTALAPALTGCDSLTGPEAASAAPRADTGGYYGSGYHTAPPCPEGDNGLIGSGNDQACTPDPE